MKKTLKIIDRTAQMSRAGRITLSARQRLNLEQGVFYAAPKL